MQNLKTPQIKAKDVLECIIRRKFEPKKSILENMKVDLLDRFKEYENNKSSTLYQSAIDVITRANWNTIKEAKKDMCEALKELMAEEFQEHEEQVTNQIIRNAYESLHDIDKVAQILKLSVEQVEKAVAPNNSI